MTPARIRELRRAGVLTRRGPLTRADEARIVLLDVYETARDHIRDHAPTNEGVRGIAFLIWFGLDPAMRDTPEGRALRWARAQARRRARRGV